MQTCANKLMNRIKWNGMMNVYPFVYLIEHPRRVREQVNGFCGHGFSPIYVIQITLVILGKRRLLFHYKH